MYLSQYILSSKADQNQGDIVTLINTTFKDATCKNQADLYILNDQSKTGLAKKGLLKKY